ncbi:MAG TPA: hypothetical protein DCM73_13875 [Clostridiales bacterium]|nr:hypothetical protein [Clostridiales bacterium]
MLQNNLEAMIDGVFPVTEERLVHLNDEIVRFGKLLNNLDRLKEFETESMKLNFHSIDLLTMLENLYGDFLAEAENKNISLQFTKEENADYLILGDADKLKQVFINLVNNAIKFTGSSGEISISLYRNGKKIFAEIKDSGIGIKKEDMPFVFERMYRADKSRHETQGNGIGLTIVKNILDLHSASIDVESEVGSGTLFKISFNASDDK